MMNRFALCVALATASSAWALNITNVTPAGYPCVYSKVTLTNVATVMGTMTEDGFCRPERLILAGKLIWVEPPYTYGKLYGPNREIPTGKIRPPN